MLQLLSLTVLVKLQQTPWRGKPRVWVQKPPKADYSNELQPLALFRQIWPTNGLLSAPCEMTVRKSQSHWVSRLLSRLHFMDSILLQ